MMNYRLAAVILLLSTGISRADVVRVSTFDHETVQMDVAIKVVGSLYQRLGHSMKVERFPGKRSLYVANNGQVDAELFRVKAASNLAPNLIRIPTPVTRFKAMALSLKGAPDIIGMGGLIGKKVGILRGIEFTDRITKNLPRQILDSIDSLFKALIHGRVEVIIFPKLDGQEYVEHMGLTEQITMHSVPLIEISTFHYIHKSKPTLIQEMTQLLEKLEKTGELDAIIYSAEQARR